MIHTKFFRLLALVITVTTFACASSSVRTQESTLNKKASSPNLQGSNANQSATSQDSTLNSEIKTIAAEANGRVGVTALVLETGETVASLNPRDHFPMQSVYKLPISLAVMQAVDAGKIKLNDKVAVTKSDMVGPAAFSQVRDRYPNGTSLTVEELLRYTLLISDGTTSDVLMRIAGGPAAVQSYLEKLGITDWKVVDTENAFSRDHSLQYRNWATPEAAVALLRALYERRGMSEASQTLILKLMTESTTGPNRLKGLLPAGTVVAHKTGTSGTEKGITAATNDIGIITLPNGKHLAIAVFVADAAADTPKREGAIAKIAQAAFQAASKS
jgi:beta-lactamase class A